MPPRLLGVDPSDMLLRIIQDAVGDLPVGYDMPQGRRKLFLTLSAGAYPTPVTQRWTLTMSAYDASASNLLDHAAAQRTWLRTARAILDARHTWPLCDAEVQAGPMTSHDTDLHVDYVYGAMALIVSAR